MAVCDPTTLANQARCFGCVPGGFYRALNVYLLNQIAATGFTPQQLLDASSSFETLSGTLYQASRVYLLATLNGGSMDPSTLANLSRCYACIPEGFRGPVENYLYATNAGGSLDVNTLLAASRTYAVLFGSEWRAELYLLARIAGITDVQAIAAGARCFISCLSPVTMSEIDIYLLCLGVTGGGGGGTVPTATGFTFNPTPTGANALATWDAPPAPVTATELWTSSDGVTYVLAATVAAPGATSTVVGPTAGNILYGKVRWLVGASTGSFGSVVRAFGNVGAWGARVIANGAAAMAQLTMNANNTFYGTIFDAGTIIAKVKAMNTIAPDSVIAARSPIIFGVGLNPWTEISALSVNVNGIKCNFVNGGMITGVNPLTHFASVNEGGLACYVHTTEDNDGGVDVDIGSFNAGNECCQLYTNFNGAPGSSFIQMFNNTTASVGVVTGNGPGYYSGNVNGGAVRLYGAKSTFPHAQLGGDGTPGGTRPNFVIFAMCLNSSGGATGSGTVRRYSFFCVSTGFTAAEDNTLYNAVQALRTALGGGFV